MKRTTISLALFMVLGFIMPNTVHADVYYNWLLIYTNSYNTDFCSPPATYGATRMYKVYAFGAWEATTTSCQGGDFVGTTLVCSISPCDARVFVFARNTDALPTANQHGLLFSDVQIVDYDTRPLTAYTQSGAPFTYGIAGLMGNPLVRGIAIALVTMAMAVLFMRMIVNMMRKQMLEGGEGGAMSKIDGRKRLDVGDGEIDNEDME